jgi:hypothetical protein
VKLKKDVTFSKLKPEAWYALGVARAIYSKNGAEFVWTCGDDSHEGKPNSKHNVGLAVDLRTNHVPIYTAQKLVKEIKDILDVDGFDVILEAAPPHIHVEFDPKPGEKWLEVLT